MAVVRWQVVSTAVDGRHVKVVKWEALTAGDTGQPFVVAQYSDKTVQVIGTFGGNVTIQGSNDPDETTATYATLNDPQGNALDTISAAKIENVLEHTYLIRPSAGAGVSDVDVWLLLGSTMG